MLTAELLIYGSLAAMLVGFAKCGIPGVGILVVPIMALIFDAKQSVGILLPMLIAADLVAVAWYREHTQWNIIGRLLPWILAGFIPGALVLAKVEGGQFRPLLGAVVLSMLGLELVRQVCKWERMPHNIGFIGFTGMLAGFSTTVGNAAGPVMTIYLLAVGMDKHKFVGSMAWMFLIINCAKVPVYFTITHLQGTRLIDAESLTFNLCMLPAIGLGALIGKKVLKKISQKVFKWTVMVLAALAAVKLVMS